MKKINGRKAIALFLGACFCLTGCSGSRKKEAEKIGYTFDKQEQLSFQEMAYPGLLGESMQILKKDSLLLINDFYGDSLIHVFNLRTGYREGALVAKGDGPGELLPPVELQWVDSQLWLLSRPLHRLSRISWEGNSRLPIENEGQASTEADCFIPLGNRQIVFSGLWDKRYGIARQGAIRDVALFGEYPDFWAAEADIPAMAKGMFHQCRFAINTSKRLFASCSYYVLDIYEYGEEGELPRLKMRKQLGKYEYDYVSSGMISTQVKPGSGLASIDIVGGKDHLYVLIQDEENRRNRNIMVLDWEGNPVKLLKSGHRIACFAIDEQEKTGYCVLQDEEDQLASFKL